MLRKESDPNWHDAVPIAAAAKLFFPHGGVTVSTLRRAIRRGELQCEIIGRGYFVTGTDIENWRELCRQNASQRTPAVRRPSRQTGLSAEERRKVAQDALARLLVRKRP